MKEKLYPKHAHTIRAESIEEFKQQVADLNELVNGGKTEVRTSNATEIVNSALKAVDSFRAAEAGVDKIDTGKFTALVEERLAPAEVGSEIKTDESLTHVNQSTNQVMNAPAPAAPVGDTDIDGIPWDARIHASSKAKTGSGKWRERRNLDPNVKAQVTAELFAKVKPATVHVEMPSSQQSAPPLMRVVNTARGPMNLTEQQIARLNAGEDIEVILGHAEPAAPVVAPVTQHIPQPSTAQQVDNSQPPQYEFSYFQKNLGVVLGDLFNQQRVTPIYLGQLSQRFGVDSLWMVMTDREKSIELFNQLAMDNVIRQVSF